MKLSSLLRLCRLAGVLVMVGGGPRPSLAEPATRVRALLEPAFVVDTSLTPPIVRSPTRVISGVVIGPGCRVVTGAAAVRDAVAIVIGADTPAEIAWIADELDLAVLVGAGRDCGATVRLLDAAAPKRGAPAVVAAPGHAAAVTVSGYADAPDDPTFGLSGPLPPEAAGAPVLDDDGALLGVLRGGGASGRAAVVPAAVVAALLAEPAVRHAMAETEARVKRWWRGRRHPPVSALLALTGVGSEPPSPRAPDGSAEAIRHALQSGSHPSDEVRVLLAAALWNHGAWRTTRRGADQRRGGCRDVDEARAALRALRRAQVGRVDRPFERDLDEAYLLHPRLRRTCGRSLAPEAISGHAGVEQSRPTSPTLLAPAGRDHRLAPLLIRAAEVVTLDLAAASPRRVIGLGVAYRHSSAWEAATGRSRRLEMPLALRGEWLRLEAGAVLRVPTGALGVVSRVAVGDDDSWSFGVAVLDTRSASRRESLREINLRLRF